MIKITAYYEKRPDNRVICHLCPFNCRLKENQQGICKSRYNRGGELVTDNYGELVTLAVDPIEKKPLYHFYPGTNILSTGPNSCNFQCKNCQNWTISQKKTETFYVSPEKLLETAKNHNSLGVAFTYTEPLMWFEYIMDCAPLLREAGLKSVLVSNGFINPEPLDELLPFIDAANIDLKSMRPEFYRKICKGKLEPVLDNLRTIASSRTHLEITNLIIPGLNDSETDISDLVEFVASLSDMIPLHFSAYFPNYQMKTIATPPETLLRALEIARRRLKYVYLGNVALRDITNTRCPQCGLLLVRRSGYHTTIIGLEKGLCRQCGYDTGIVQ